MLMLLWFLMIFSPVFIIVSLWTKLIKETRVKVLCTWISAFSIIMIWRFWVVSNNLEESEKTISYASSRDVNYIQCLDSNSESLEDMFDYCVIPNVKLLRTTYWM